MLKQLKKALNALTAKEKQWGFTKVLKGKLNRYVIGLTNNVIESWEVSEAMQKRIAIQAQIIASSFNNVTIWGWTSKAWDFYLDIGTSSDNLEEALKLWREKKQIAIFDLKTMKEIYC